MLECFIELMTSIDQNNFLIFFFIYVVLSHINGKAMVSFGYSMSTEAKNRDLITCNFVTKKV